MTHRFARLLLVAGCVLLSAILFVELNRAGPEDPAIAGVAPQPEGAAAIHRQQSPRLDDLVATALARPLFSSTRRPPQTASAGGTGDNDLADRRLTGIVTAPGHRLAIFAVNGDKPLTVAEGDEVSGWRVESITPREVSLTGPSGTKTLLPKLDPNLALPSTPPPVANLTARPPIPTPGTPRLPQPPGAAGQPNRAVPVNVPGGPPRPGRVRQQR